MYLNGVAVDHGRDAQDIAGPTGASCEGEQHRNGQVPRIHSAILGSGAGVPASLTVFSKHHRQENQALASGPLPNDLHYEYCDNIQVKKPSKMPHGGARPGAGRPLGGRYGEPTRTVRVPESRMTAVVALLDEFRKRPKVRSVGNAIPMPSLGESLPRLHLPMFESPRAQAGFPSPAADYIEDRIDLNELLIRNPPATFCVRIKGDSMTDIGMLDGDVVTVDRSIEGRAGKVVVAAYDGDIFVKRLRKIAGRLALCSENSAKAAEYPPMYLDQAQEHTVWGVVTGVVRSL